MPGNLLHNDSSLLQRLAGGDQEAFEAIYHRYWRELLNAAYKRLGNRQQAEDLIQNVFLRLWKRRAHLQVADLCAYLHTAVRYETLNFVTRAKPTSAFYRHLEDMPADTELPDARILTTELMELVYAYAATLPSKRRNIFLLHVRDRLSTKQIAEALTISQKTVQNQLITALKGLRARLIPLVIAFLAGFL